jgi:Cu+-exporting ATPase
MSAEGHHHHAVEGADGKTAIDPVCGMKVDPKKTAHRALHEGETYVFCSAGCRTKFEAEPGKYLNAAGRPPAPAEQKT